MLEVPQPLTKVIFEDEHAALEALRDRLLAQPWIQECEMAFSAANLLELTGMGSQ